MILLIGSRFANSLSLLTIEFEKHLLAIGRTVNQIFVNFCWAYLIIWIVIIAVGRWKIFVRLCFVLLVNYAFLELFDGKNLAGHRLHHVVRCLIIWTHCRKYRISLLMLLLIAAMLLEIWQLIKNILTLRPQLTFIFLIFSLKNIICGDFRNNASGRILLLRLLLHFFDSLLLIDLFRNSILKNTANGNGRILTGLWYIAPLWYLIVIISNNRIIILTLLHRILIFRLCFWRCLLFNHIIDLLFNHIRFYLLFMGR